VAEVFIRGIVVRRTCYFAFEDTAFCDIVSAILPPLHATATRMVQRHSPHRSDSYPAEEFHSIQTAILFDEAGQQQTTGGVTHFTARRASILLAANVLASARAAAHGSNWPAQHVAPQKHSQPLQAELAKAT